MVSKTDLAVWLAALSLLLALGVGAVGVLCLLLGALLARVHDDPS